MIKAHVRMPSLFWLLFLAIVFAFCGYTADAVIRIRADVAAMRAQCSSRPLADPSSDAPAS